MTLRLALSLLFAAATLAPAAFGQALGADQPPAGSTPTVRAITAGMPLEGFATASAPRFPLAADWKNYGVALSSTAAEDLAAAAKLFSGQAKADEDKISLPGMCLVETLMLGMNPGDRAGTRKAVMEAVFAGIKKPDEDPKASQRAMTRFFEDRQTFGNGAVPVSALERYKAVLSQKAGLGWEEPARVPFTQAVIDAVARIHRSADEQKSIDAYFARAAASVKEQAAALKK